MLNPNTQERELCYVVKIDDIKPIPGRDRVESAVVGGWTVMVRKSQFKPGDLGIYFEIDSKCPAKPEFEFLAAKHYKIKTQKYAIKDENGNKLGQYWSQGLLMGFEDFDKDGFQSYMEDNGLTGYMNGKYYHEGDFLTQELGVTYADPDDNARKAKSADKYKKMAQRHGKLFSKPIFKWLMRRTWGKKLLFIFFGKAKDKRVWPTWVVKTDEERVQNMPWILADKTPWYATEKIDGTSTTFTMKGFGRKREFYVCSRNVCFDTPEKMAKGAFYDTNVYQEMAIKYDIENVLADILNAHKDELDFVTLQGETYGNGIQKRDYSLKGHDFMAFNLIYGYKDGHTERFNPSAMTSILKNYNVPCIPIVDELFVMPDTVEELLEIATDKSKIDGGMREGLVFRSADGTKSFKAVSNEFLMKYHNG